MAGPVIPKDLKGPFSSPLELFPAELWSKIFEAVRDPEDMINVMHTCDEFYEIVQPERKFFLLTKVLAILDNRGLLEKADQNVPSHTSPSGEKDKHLPHLMTPMKCRLVCKSWDRAVQDYLQLHPAHFRMGSHKHLQAQVYEFSSKNKVRKFQERFETSHSSVRNPFVTRQVVFRDIVLDEYRRREFVYSIAHFLNTFGGHIYHLSLYFVSREHMPRTLYYVLQHWIGQAPNLKTLRIFYRARYPFQVILKQQRLEAQLQPMSALKNLVLLHTKKVPSAVCQEILRSNSHVIKLTSHVGDTRYDIYFRGMVLNNLREWGINLCCREDILHLQSALTGQRWPVETLRINFSGGQFGHEVGRINFNRLFRTLEKSAGQTLTNLELIFPYGTRWATAEKEVILQNIYNMYLNLPHLQQLNVKLPGLSSVNFLLSLRDSLEELRITFYVDREMSLADRSLEIIQLNGMFDGMEKSNIWQLLPKLKLLEIFWDESLYRALSNPTNCCAYDKPRKSGIIKRRC